MNLSLIQAELKLAKVVTIFKSGDVTQVYNYRLISVLPLFSKRLEKPTYVRLLSFINKHNLHYEYQFGFRAKHGTNMALTIIVDKIMQALQNNELFIGIVLDFRNAFIY